MMNRKPSTGFRTQCFIAQPIRLSLITLSLLLAACQSTRQPEQQAGQVPSVSRDRATLFTEVPDKIPLEKRPRRKWDAPIIGDLDGDGLQDMILTEHAHKVFIAWNTGNGFEGSQELISGDMHGLAIADLDQDGKIDILIAQGGGAGSNPRKPLHYEALTGRQFSKANVLEHFENSRGRSIKIFDADNDGNVDLYLTGFATPRQMKNGANHLYKNTGNGSFEFVSHIPHGDRLSYKSLVLDYNNDGLLDLLTFGGNNMALAKNQGNFKFEDVSKAALTGFDKTEEASSVSLIDYDKDGDYDLVISRAEHQFEQEAYYDAENKRFAFFSRFEPYLINELRINGDFNAENLQMAYPHFDVFVGGKKQMLNLKSEQYETAEASYDTDREGVLDFRLTQTQAAGWPEGVCAQGVKLKELPEGLKPGLYIGYVGSDTWRICAQTKSPTAAVVHNVLHNPGTTQDEPLPAVILENRNGVFVDVTKELGLEINEQTTSVVVADFDNDGWSDLFFVRYGNMATQTRQIVYLNNQGKGFQRLENSGVISKELGATGSGGEAIDFDKDGDIDLIYANERGLWHLFENNNRQTSNNNFIGFTVGNSPSGKASALGARVTIDACGQKDERIVGNATTSFGTSINTDLHFGLGACSKVDRAKVYWTTGESQTISAAHINEYEKIKAVK